MNARKAFFEKIKGKIIISCQALTGEPLYVEEKSIMYLMARAAKMAGAPAIRTNSVRDVIAIREETGLPVIGLIKRNYPDSDVFITPTMDEVDALVGAKADVIALDCTGRLRPGAKGPAEFLREIRSKYPDLLLMADISTFEEGLLAHENGADIVGTTMSGYTPYSPQREEPDVDLVRRLSLALPCPVIAEGRIHEPRQAVEMLEAGAFSVVVGGAITRPLEIAKRFIQAVEAGA